jgi:hypothetical protein
MWILVLILTALNCAQSYRYRRLAMEIRKLSANVTALIVERSNTVFYSSNTPSLTGAEDFTVKIVPWAAETDKRKLH